MRGASCCRVVQRRVRCRQNREHEEGHLVLCLSGCRVAGRRGGSGRRPQGMLTIIVQYHYRHKNIVYYCQSDDIKIRKLRYRARDWPSTAIMFQQANDSLFHRAPYIACSRSICLSGRLLYTYSEKIPHKIIIT